MKHHTYTVLALAAAVALCTSAHGQSVQSSKIVIGDGASSKGSKPAYTQPDESAFVSALTAIGGSLTSGTIEVMPGTYTFDSVVQITDPGVRISGGPNAVLTLAASFDGPLFSVRAPATDCVIDGLTLLFEGGVDDPGGKTLIDVVGHGFTLTNCRILVSGSSGSTAPADSVAIRVSPPTPPNVLGALIEGNSFRVGRVDDPGGENTLVDALGWTLVHSTNGRNLRVIGNDFRSGRLDLDATPAQLRNAIQLIDEEWTAIVGNTFAHLESGGAAPGAASALVGSLEVGQESNHLTFTGNLLAACDGPSNLSLEGHGYSSITGNTFDRQGSHAAGTVQLLGTKGVTLSGNSFTNRGEVTGPSLMATGGFFACVQGNAFVEPDDPQVGQTDPQVYLLNETGALLTGNQFVAEANSTFQLRVQDSTDCSLVGNRFDSGACKPIDLFSSTAQDIFICSNQFELPVCSPPAWQVTGYGVRQCDDSSGNPSF